MDKRKLIETYIMTFILCTSQIICTEDIRLPPYLTEQPPRFQEIKSGDNNQITLPCLASGVPEPHYTWYKNGNPMGYTTHTYLKGGSLYFEVPTPLDEGYYQCEAENQYGKALSVKTEMKLTKLGQFSDISTVTTLTAAIGEQLTLTCNPPVSQPEAKISWGLVTEGSVTSTPSTINLDKRIQIDEDGNLMFSNINRVDEQSGYNYVCSAQNTNLLQTSGGSLHKIRVSGQSVSNKTPIIMYRSSGPVVGIETEDVVLQCFFSGSPTPSVSWKKKGGNLPSGGRSIREQHDTKLRIKHLRFSDAGTYICTAGNTVGSSDEVEIELDVQSVPTFKSSNKPINVNVTMNEEAVINCNADSKPVSEVQWFINGDPIDVYSPPNRILVDTREGTLKIRKVCKDCNVVAGSVERTTDLMVVQCNASNVHGYAFEQGYVNVLNKTLIYERPPSEITVALGEHTVLLPCHATTDDATELFVRWYKGNEPISSLGDQRLVEKSNNDLSINLKGLTDDEKGDYQSVYKCEAMNGYSTDLATTNIIIEGAPIPVEISQASFPLWIIIVIVAVILLLLIIIMCCCICKNQGKGDVYNVDENEKKKGYLAVEDYINNTFREYVRPDSAPTKGSRASLASSIPLESDDDYMMDMYGDPDMGRFKEDGSFLGQYDTKKNKKGNNVYDNTNSNYA